MSDIEEEETQQRNSLEDVTILSSYLYLHFLRQQQQQPPQFSPNIQQQLSGSQKLYNLPPPVPVRVLFNNKQSRNQLLVNLHRVIK